MRKRFGLVVVVALSMGVSGSASALSLEESSLTFKLGPLPEAVVFQAAGQVPVSATGGGGFVLPASLMNAQKPNNIVPHTALFTGVSLISSLSLTVANRSGTLSPNGGFNGGFGGTAQLRGVSTVGVLGGLLNLKIPLAFVGISSLSTYGYCHPGHPCTLPTGMRWTTGMTSITGITTTTTTFRGKVKVVNTVFLTGSDNRTGRGGGRMSLVTPTRVLTNFVGNLPAPSSMVLKFVPEPGAVVMLVSGIALMAVAGYRRNRN